MDPVRIGSPTRSSAISRRRRRSRSRLLGRSWHSMTIAPWRCAGADFVVTVGDHLAASAHSVPGRREVARAAFRRALTSGVARTSPWTAASTSPVVLGSRATHRGDRHGRLSRPRAARRRPTAARTVRRHVVAPRASRAAAAISPRGHAPVRVLARPQLDYSRRMRSTRCSRRPTRFAPNRIAWGFVSKGPRSDASSRRRHHLRRDAARRAAGAARRVSRSC